MNLITHLVKTDIRRSRALLVAWLLLLALQSLLACSGWVAGDRGAQMIFAMISQFMPKLEILLFCVLVPFVVQADPLAGTTAFWLTRPISRPTLLAAKAGFAVAVILLPAVLVEVFVFSANGMTVRDTALVVPEVLLTLLMWIVPVAILAAITPNFGRYAIAGAALVVAIATVGFVASWMQHFFTSQIQNFSLAKSSLVAVSLWIIVGGGAVVAGQYLTRRTVRTIVAGAIVAVLILPLELLWTWDFIAPPRSKSAPPFDVSAVKIELNGSVFAQEIMTANGEGAPDKQVDGNIEAAGLPASYIARTTRVRPHLHLPNGAALPVRENLNIPLMINLHAEALETALGGISVVNATGLNYSAGLFIVDADTYSEYANQPLTFSADIDCLASKYAISAQMALAQGARFDRGSVHMVITGILRQSDGVDILLRERAPNLLFNGSNRFAPGYVAAPGYQSVFVLRNKKRNEAVLEKLSDVNVGSFNLFGLSTLVNHLQRISFGPEPQHNRLTPALNDEWLADAELILLDLVPVGEFSTQLAPAKIRMNGSNGFNAETAAEPKSPPVTKPKSALVTQPKSAFVENLAQPGRKEL